MSINFKVSFFPPTEILRTFCHLTVRRSDNSGKQEARKRLSGSHSVVQKWTDRHGQSLCLQLSLLCCTLAPHKVANWNFLGDPGSLPSFLAKGMSCSFYIFASWALKVDRLRSSKNSSINVSRFWNTTEKTRKSSAVGVIRKWCQMLSEVFEKQTWPWLYLDSVHSLPRLWEPVFIMILLCFFLDF